MCVNLLVWGRNKFFLFDQSFLLRLNHIAVHLLQLRVLLVQYVPCFVHLSLEAFPISAIRKCLICRKSTFSHLFYSIFSLKILSCIAFLFPTPLKSKLEQSWHYRKANISKGYSMSPHKSTL